MPDGSDGHDDDDDGNGWPISEAEALALAVRGCLIVLTERAAEVTDDEAAEVMELAMRFCAARMQLAQRSA